MIAELAKQFFEAVLVNGGLEYTDDNGRPGNLKIAQVCIDDVDDKNIDENEGQYRFPIVVFEEGTSNPKPSLYTPNTPDVSPLYDTNLRVIAYAHSIGEVEAVCYAAQVAVLRGFHDLAINSSETRIDAVSWGTKLPAAPASFRNSKVQGVWNAVRSIIITNRLEP